MADGDGSRNRLSAPIFSPRRFRYAPLKNARYARNAVVALACVFLATTVTLAPLQLIRFHEVLHARALRRGLHTHDNAPPGTQREVRIAYFVQVSGTNHPRLPSLLRALCEPGRRSTFAVHFDKSMPDSTVSEAEAASRSALSAAGCASSEMQLLPREHVTYRGITLTHNIISAAAHLLRSGAAFDYFINLSAADYPTARPALIRALLSQADVRDHRLMFIAWSAESTWARFARERVARVHVDSALASGQHGQFFRYVRENIIAPHVGFTVAKSSSWFIFPRDFVEHLVLDSAARRMLSVFAFSDIGDEHYFASVIWNDERFRARTVPTNFRSIFFSVPEGTAAPPADGVTRSHLHPFYVDKLDEDGQFLFWDRLVQRPGFFTRKLRTIVGSPTRLTRRCSALRNMPLRRMKKDGERTRKR